MKKYFLSCLFMVTFFIGIYANPSFATVDSSQSLADQIIKSEIPVLIDFWAPWCMPCRMLGPIIGDIKKEYHGKIEVMKINTDIHKQIANYFGISSIPAVFIVKDKKVVKYLMGVQAKEAYVSAVEEVLGMNSEASDETPTKKES